MITRISIQVENDGGHHSATLIEHEIPGLSDGDVLIEVHWSGLNYKDALAISGKGSIMRHFPMTAGIDAAGIVIESRCPDYRPGQPVVAVGAGLSETHDGGLTTHLVLPGAWLSPLPDGLTLRQAMALGTAGFTAGLAVTAMLRNDQHPDRGPIAVTGATGGVGSWAIDLLASRGFEVHAITGKPAATDYLRAIGAHVIVDRATIAFTDRPLAKGRWGGAIDNLGGQWLSWLTRTVVPHGNIASVGLASGHDLTTTVMPFILRGVNLLGINSVILTPEQRRTTWNRLGTDLRPHRLEHIATREIGLAEVLDVAPSLLAGEHLGRTLVKIR